jgi:hypothetical protein
MNANQSHRENKVRPSRIPYALIVAAIVVSTMAMGCGPMEATLSIARAQKAIYEAESNRASAGVFSAYPYQSAKIYLHLARTKHGFGEYEICEEYASKALERAELAVLKARAYQEFLIQKEESLREMRQKDAE